jgi:predicted dehydrogenase
MIAERRHAPVLAGYPDRVQVVALCDLSEERTFLIGEMIGVPAAHQYQDYRQMLERENLDLVAICTPHNAHEAQAIAAMQAGAHVLLEKPIALTLDQVDRIIAAAQRYNRKMTVSHNQIFSPASQMAKQLIGNGEIGRVFLIRLEGYGRQPILGRGRDPDWRSSLDAGGGGPLIDNGFHSVYKAVDWANSRVKRVFARIGTYVHTVQVEDMALLLMEHENGAITSIQVGSCAPGGAAGMQEILGTQGQIRLAYRGESPVSVWQRSTGEWSAPPVEPEPPDRLGFHILVNEFLQAIETDGPVPVTGEESRHILAAVLAAYESGRTGRPVEVV